MIPNKAQNTILCEKSLYKAKVFKKSFIIWKKITTVCIIVLKLSRTKLISQFLKKRKK